jgi:acetyl esterase/lipase
LLPHTHFLQYFFNKFTDFVLLQYGMLFVHRLSVFSNSLNNMMKNFIILAILISLSSCRGDLNLIVPSTDLTPGGIGTPLIYEEKTDLFYGKNSFQSYDLYLPSTRNTRNPVIVFIHPGAWRIGDKSQLNSLVKILISKRVNCAIVNANYRLTSTTGITYTQQMDDINSLLVKLKNDAKTLGISSNFYLVGISAGGHLAMLYANSPLGEKLAVGVAGVVPPVNLTSTEFRNGGLKNDIVKLIGKTYAEAPEEYFKASPIFQLNQASPPMIVFFGGQDTAVPIEQSDICKKMMTVSRIKNEFNFYPNLGHEWNIWDETLDKIIKFAEKNL